MKRFFYLLPSCFSLFVLCSGCTNSTEEKGEYVFKEHSYNEIKDFEITWDEIFDQKRPNYYVYAYGLSCPHCNNIKNEIIEFALSNQKTYFCLILSGFDKYTDFAENTIGATSVEYLAIKGTPTLIEIHDGAVVNNICGDLTIKEEILSYFNA